MIRWCRRCGHAFDAKGTEHLCARCAPKPVPFDGPPIDLAMQWS